MDIILREHAIYFCFNDPSRRILDPTIGAIRFSNPIFPHPFPVAKFVSVMLYTNGQSIKLKNRTASEKGNLQ